MTISYEWRGDFDNAEVDALHAEAFRHGGSGADRRSRVRRHSLGWVCARRAGALVGFVNVAWDGGVHAFVLDTMVSRELRGAGIGTGLVAAAAREARAAHCAWLHVDFEERLSAFYVEACGFRPTAAGLIPLS
ncbi:GNAT family N-acetyltransferase [Streptomyces sp. NPDC102473]|uniref:GNAT family N-acetyltransferase n=1 Tax=Streptomyces sp. NPDC102473 TaxID=3366180 RepID=UPI00382DDF39